VLSKVSMSHLIFDVGLLGEVQGDMDEAICYFSTMTKRESAKDSSPMLTISSQAFLHAFRHVVAIILYLMASTAAVAQSAACSDGEITVGGTSAIWSLPNGTRLSVYNGQYEIRAIASCGNGVVAVFGGQNAVNWAYYSPDCQNIGGGGNTERVYGGTHVNRGLAVAPNGVGVLSSWQRRDGGPTVTYYSPNCRNIGGGGLTTVSNLNLAGPPTFNVPNVGRCVGEACEFLTWTRSTGCTIIGNVSERGMEVRFGAFTFLLSEGEEKSVVDFNGNCLQSFVISGLRARFL